MFAARLPGCNAAHRAGSSATDRLVQVSSKSLQGFRGQESRNFDILINSLWKFDYQLIVQAVRRRECSTQVNTSASFKITTSNVAFHVFLFYRLKTWFHVELLHATRCNSCMHKLQAFKRVEKYSQGKSVAADDSVWWNHVA